MGVFDLPAPLLDWIDGQLTAILPPVAKLALWALVGAVVSMELYRLLSPQCRIAQLKSKLKEVQRQVSNCDGPLSEARPLIGRMLSLALRRVIIVFPATILASLPLLALVVWIDNNYGWSFPPPGQPAKVAVAEPFQGRWIELPERRPPRAQVVDRAGGIVADIPLKAPVPIVHKAHWWNQLIGNPAGYLAHNSPIDRIEIGLSRQEFLPVGPPWLRGWEFAFFSVLIVLALALKFVRRIG